MTSGYVSRQAVNEMLAVKQGELDFLAKELAEKEQTIEQLSKELKSLKNQT